MIEPIWYNCGMMLIKILLNILALYLTILIIPSVKLKGGFFSLLGMILMVSILNWSVRPLLILLTLPITFLTLGLFLLVINGVVFLLAAGVVKKVEIDNLPSAIVMWGVYTLISFTLNFFLFL